MWSRSQHLNPETILRWCTNNSSG